MTDDDRPFTRVSAPSRPVPLHLRFFAASLERVTSMAGAIGCSMLPCGRWDGETEKRQRWPLGSSIAHSAVPVPQTSRLSEVAPCQSEHVSKTDGRQRLGETFHRLTPENVSGAEHGPVIVLLFFFLIACLVLGFERS